MVFGNYFLARSSRVMLLRLVFGVCLFFGYMLDLSAACDSGSS